MAQIYNIDGSIQSFFESSTSVSRQQCDAYVLSRFQTPARPVPLQGVWSYTVTAGDGDDARIVQFREQASPLDRATRDLVKQAAAGFAADVLYRGTIGEQRPLHIYEMNKLPGQVYMLAADHTIPQPEDAKARQRNTIQDLATFFAQSWNCKQPPSDPVALAAEYRSKLGLLAASLPARFSQQLQSLQPHLLSVFTQLPQVLTHGDLNELNMLVDPATGRITGIVDWAEASVLPFGFALWGVENILGYMNAQGWRYYDNHEALRALFWKTFLQKAPDCTEQDIELIRIVRLMGLFCRHGFVRQGQALISVVGETATSSMAYLDAFCLLDTAPS